MAEPYLAPGRSHRILRVLAAVVTICLLAWTIWYMDWGAIGAIVTTARGVGFLLLAVLCSTLGQVFNSWRLLSLLRVQNRAFPFPDALKLTFVGSFASLFLPSTVGGDLVRVAGLRDREVPARLSVLAIERIVSFSSMLVLVPFSFISLGPQAFQSGSILAAGRKFIGSVFREIMNWRSHPRALLVTFFLSLASFASGWASAWSLCFGLGIQVEYWDVVRMGVWIYMAGVLPFAINGLGIQEVSYIFLYGLLGVAAPLAATLGLLVRVVYSIAVLPGGVWFALQPEMRAFLRKKNPADVPPAETGRQ